MGKREYGALIVGGGPAGSTAARELAQAGHTVLVVDRRRVIGTPVQCAEFISRAGWDGPADCIAQPIAELVTHLPDGSVHTSRSPGYTIDRDRYDAYLAQEALRAGAEYRLNAYGRIGDAKVIVQNGSVESIRTAVVINATGRTGLASARSRQVTLRLKKPIDDIHVWLGPEYPGGYAWLFPKGEWANVGLAVTAAIDLKLLLEAFVASLKREFGVEGVPERLTGGRIPVGGPTELVEGNVLSVGDAAGITHPVSGEGIHRAVTSGRLAGRSAVGFLQTGVRSQLDEYPNEFFGIYRANIERAKERRTLWERLWRHGPLSLGQYRRVWIGFPEYYAKGESE